MPTPLTDTMHEIVMVLAGRRFRLASETQTQADIAAAFAACGIAFAREHRLSPKDRLDFLCGRVAVEVKTQGAKIAVYRQCARYCEHPDIDGLILATNMPMRLPALVNGKPCAVVNLGKAWL